MNKHLNKVVMCFFWDHSHSYESSEIGPVYFRVVGVLKKITDIHYEISSWDDPSGESINNNETFSILRSTVVKMYRFGNPIEIKKHK